MTESIPQRPSAQTMSSALMRRSAERVARMDDAAVQGMLAEVVYLERRRFSLMGRELPESDQLEREAIETVARAIRGGRRDWESALDGLVSRYAHEIHNEFSDRTYRFATRLLPGMLTRLLTTTGPRSLLTGSFDPTSRIRVEGDTEQLARLAETHTLVLAPTHLSNLDSPLLGYGLYVAGLPPFIYGAGLNLFTNPTMAFFMSRLGAYTVDRRKKHGLYKETLKDYSVEALTRRTHSLFFPGGTRARSGAVERSVKKGLLGTAITAWQENLQAGRAKSEVLVVPCTLSYALVLEASTLIEDALQETGKSRYIISDDEFSEPRTVATFARRVLELDASVIVRFGQPLDLMGNPVDGQGRSLDHRGEPMDRRSYVCDRDGNVVFDGQRDRVYTDRLGRSLVEHWHRDNILMSTHVAAFAAWHQLRRLHPGLDPWQVALLSGDERLLPRSTLTAAIDRVLAEFHTAEQAGRLRTFLPGEGSDQAEAVLDHAVETFGRFHSEPGLAVARDRGQPMVRVFPKLALYYGNRADNYGLEAAARGDGSSP